MIWDIGAEWAVYIAEEYFEDPDFILRLLLENKNIDLATLRKETRFMETIDKIKKVLAEFYDCEQYRESQEEDNNYENG